MKNQQINITDSEWKIMQVLWQSDGHLTTGEVAKALEGIEKWSKRTIQTLIRRLVDKEAVAYTEARHYKYYATVTEEKCLKEEMKSMLKRLFHSSPNKLVSTLVETENLDIDQIDEMMKLLEGIRKQAKDV